jgi:hypothetical protein
VGQQSADRLPRGYRGVTFCRDGVVEVWQRRNTPDDGLGKARDDAVLRHELKHAEQYQQRGCARMDSLRQMPDSVLVLEVEAMCEEMRVLVRYDQNERDLLGSFVLEAMRESGVTNVPKIAELFLVHCPELMPQ